MENLPDRVRCGNCHCVREVTAPPGVPHMATKRKPWFFALPCAECGQAKLESYGLSQKRQELAEKWHPLARRQAMRFAGRLREVLRGVDVEAECHDAAMTALMRAALRYDASTGRSPGTYVGTSVNRELFCIPQNLSRRSGRLAVVRDSDCHDGEGVSLTARAPGRELPPEECLIGREQSARDAELAGKVRAAARDEEMDLIESFHLEGQSHAEIGRRLGVSRFVASMRMRRGVSRIRAVLGQEVCRAASHAG